jgi:undecaprenyl-diphosphatase
VALTLGLTGAAAGNSVLPGDVAVQRSIQAVSVPGAQPLADAVNWIGGTLGILLVGVAIAWWCARRGQTAAVVVVLGALALRVGNGLIKSPVASPRPSDDLVRVAEEANGYGFPSAHVMGVVLLYGAILLLAPDMVRCRTRRCLVQAAALVMLLTIGYGRIHAGAHWPSDVLGAYLYGILGLAGLLALYRAIQSGRLPDPEMLIRAAVARVAGLAGAAVRFVLPMPAGRSSAQAVPVPVSRAGAERRRGE